MDETDYNIFDIFTSVCRFSSFSLILQEWGGLYERDVYTMDLTMYANVAFMFLQVSNIFEFVSLS